MRQAAAEVDGWRTGDEPVRTGFMLKLFVAFLGLAVLSFGVSMAGRWFGGSLALAGYTDDRTPFEIVVGDNVIAAPANMIRFERARRHGVASRLDLYMRWPALDGYSAEARDDFNNTNGQKDIIFLSFEPRMMSRDMSGRFEPIYRALIAHPGRKVANYMQLYGFTSQSGYMNEELAVAPRVGADPFVARCLTGRIADESLAPCERDIAIGDDLSVTYRFPRSLLADWVRLDAAVTSQASHMLRTAR